MKYVSEYQQKVVRYQDDIAVALMGAISQCASRIQITEPLPVLPIFEAPPSLAGLQAEDEHNEEEDDDEEDQEEGQRERGPDEAGQGNVEVAQDEGMDEGDE